MKKNQIITYFIIITFKIDCNEKQDRNRIPNNNSVNVLDTSLYIFSLFDISDQT